MSKRNDIEKTMECGKACKGIEVPTEEELEALNALRDIKNRVRDLKKELSEVSTTDGDNSNERTSELHNKLAQLKGEWNKWDMKRKEAARIRMIMLRHEK